MTDWFNKLWTPGDLKVLFAAYYSAIERGRDEGPGAKYVIREALHFLYGATRG